MESSGPPQGAAPLPQFVQQGQALPAGAWQYAPAGGGPSPARPDAGIPEGASGDYFASWGRRAVGLIIDCLLPLAFYGLLVLGLAAWFNATVDQLNEDTVFEYLLVGFGLLSIGLLILGTAATAISFYAYGRSLPRRGQSFGRQAVGIRVQRIDGQDLRVSDFWMRYFVPMMIGAMTCGIYFIFDYLWPLFDPRKQSLSDKMADTVVVDLRSELARERPEPIATPAPVLAAALASVVIAFGASAGGAALIAGADTSQIDGDEIERALDDFFDDGWTTNYDYESYD